MDFAHYILLLKTIYTFITFLYYYLWFASLSVSPPHLFFFLFPYFFHWMHLDFSPTFGFWSLDLTSCNMRYDTYNAWSCFSCNQATFSPFKRRVNFWPETYVVFLIYFTIYIYKFIHHFFWSGILICRFVFLAIYLWPKS